MSAGTIIVNDGIQDLPIAEGLAYLTYPRKALGIRFDNTGTGLSAKTLQAAVVEASTMGGGSSGAIDGGSASSVYLTSELIDGGGA